MEEATLFMAKKAVKRPSDLIGELNEQHEKKRLKKAARRVDDDYQIVKVDAEEDNDRERRKKLSIVCRARWQTHLQSVAPDIFTQNIVAVSQLASYLYLDPTTVIQYCYYWLGEYNNREIPPHLLFNDLIRGVLTNLPYIEVSGHYGLKYKLDGRSSYCLLFHFAGSELHRVPHVHFTQRGTSSSDRENAALLKGFAYLTNPTNKCFLNVSGSGMRAELQADNFVYNTVLEEFFEPSFIIMTCFLLAINYQAKSFLYKLVSNKKVRRRVLDEINLELTQKRMDLILTSLTVLEEYVEAHSEDDIESDHIVIEGERVKRRVKQYDGIDRDCIDLNDATGHLKRSRLVYDLVTLIAIIKENIHDPSRMQQCVAQKWLEKANYCAKEMPIRMQSIIDKL